MAATSFVVAMHTDTRLQLIQDWLANEVALERFTLAPASADASFRRYFRATTAQRSLIVMDAPPDKEDTGPFLHVRALLADCDVHVPKVFATDTARGLLLLEDLGDQPLLAALDAGADPAPLYDDALKALASIQVRGLRAMHELPEYDEAVLRRELALMPEWFCTHHLQWPLTDAQQRLIADAEDFLVQQILAMPQVFVHRDYHSRNLMITPTRSPGIIDFQDALRGPAPYDVVSLLKDCYVQWPRRRIEDWVGEFRKQVRKRMGAGTDLCAANQMEYMRWLDLVGLQRHLKVLGIFARLFWRDGKRGYLKDLPRTLDYVIDASYRFTELRPFAQFAEQVLAARLPAANDFALQARIE
jgi:hypothetical protein